MKDSPQTNRYPWRFAALVLLVTTVPAVAADGNIATGGWFETDDGYALCGSCFEVDPIDVDPSLVPSYSHAFASATGPGSSGIAGKQKEQKKQGAVYVPPNWVAGDTFSGTWISTGLLGAGWIAQSARVPGRPPKPLRAAV